MRTSFDKKCYNILLVKEKSNEKIMTHYILSNGNELFFRKKNKLFLRGKNTLLEIQFKYYKLSIISYI